MNKRGYNDTTHNENNKEDTQNQSIMVRIHFD